MSNISRALSETKLKIILRGMAAAMRWGAKNSDKVQDLMSEKNFTVQIRIKGENLGRWFQFKEGKLISKAGRTERPDGTMIFYTPEEALKLLKPRRDRLEAIHISKTFNVESAGDDACITHFLSILGELMSIKTKYGTNMPDGTVRYTGNTNGGPVFVYVKNDKIIRITHINLDKEDADGWTIEARGRKFTPPRKTTVVPYTAMIRSTVYSKDRILYPMKRVDFDPDGERNPQNRGISGYERISWDEALDITTKEMMRVKREHGPGAIMNGSGSHHTWGHIGYWLSMRRRFGNIVGTSWVSHNPDSWEGWYWGAMHHWGNSMRLGITDSYSTVEDTLKNCEMMVFWSSDPESTSGVYGAQEATIRRLWCKELGIKFVHIDPYYNHTAALMGGKWFAPRPATDHALVHAIAYVWMTEDTYDKWFVENRTTGFDEWKAYVLGEEDGIPKTPEWQEAETCIPARDVRALAREWAKSKTYLACGGISGFGSACRSATGIEWARGMVYLAAMQGIGKPGVNIGCMQLGTPLDTRFFFPGYSEGVASGDIAGTANAVNMYQKMPQLITMNTIKQCVPRLQIPEAIMDGEALDYPTDPSTIEGQFVPLPFPAPGMSTIKMYHKYGGSHFGTQSETNRYAKMYKSPNLEFVVNQSIWFEGEAAFADVILPACTNFERWDIGETAHCSGYITHSYLQNNYRTMVIQHKCIEPLGESKSDFEIFKQLSMRLGIGGYFTEGSTELDWCKRVFEASDLPRVISWKKFLKKGYYVVPAPAPEKRDPVSWNWYYHDRMRDTPEVTPLPADHSGKWRYGLQTQSGKIEFVASSLKRHDPNDPERPVMSKYIKSWEGHHTKELYEKYPLHLISPHSRYSFHTMQDAKDSWLNDIEDHRVLLDGWYYWVVRINPADAAKKNIKEHDKVEMFNDRGSVILAAHITERVPEGTVHSYESSAIYSPVGLPGVSPDKGGCVNILTPKRPIIKRSHSIACNSCLVDLRLWDEKKYKNEHPEAFNTEMSPVLSGSEL